MNRKNLEMIAGCLLLLLLLGPCLCTPSPSAPNVTAEQLQVINTQLDTLDEMIAAVQSPGGWMMLVFAISILVPVLLAAGVLFQADRSALHRDEIIRQVTHHGLSSEILETDRLLEGESSKPVTRRLARWQGRLFPARGRERQASGSGDEEENPDTFNPKGG